jgi:hypothetical protein
VRASVRARATQAARRQRARAQAGSGIWRRGAQHARARACAASCVGGGAPAAARREATPRAQRAAARRHIAGGAAWDQSGEEPPGGGTCASATQRWWPGVRRERRAAPRVVWSPPSSLARAPRHQHHAAMGTSGSSLGRMPPTHTPEPTARRPAGSSQFRSRAALPHAPRRAPRCCAPHAQQPLCARAPARRGAKGRSRRARTGRHVFAVNSTKKGRSRALQRRHARRRQLRGRRACRRAGPRR